MGSFNQNEWALLGEESPSCQIRLNDSGPVIASDSEAIHASRKGMDCFVASLLAMTVRGGQARTLQPNFVSFPRKRESRGDVRALGLWIPACAGMTIGVGFTSGEAVN
jgi:hypothetical protein